MSAGWRNPCVLPLRAQTSGLTRDERFQAECYRGRWATGLAPFHDWSLLCGQHGQGNFQQEGFSSVGGLRQKMCLFNLQKIFSSKTLCVVPTGWHWAYSWQTHRVEAQGDFDMRCACSRQQLVEFISCVRVDDVDPGAWDFIFCFRSWPLVHRTYEHLKERFQNLDYVI